MSRLKTFVRWPGNKSRYLKDILRYIPVTFNTYFEPFLGSGALFLHLQPENWWINDINQNLINYWLEVMLRPDQVIRSIQNFGKMFQNLQKNEQLTICKQITNHLHNENNKSKRAILFILMGYCSYSGNIIDNTSNYKFQGLDMNFSRGYYTFLSNRSFENIRKASSFLSRTNGKITNSDYKKILKYCKEGDFVFLDPPYFEDHEYHFQYNKNETESKFEKTLFSELNKLSKKGVKWLLTQPDTDKIRNLYRSYLIVSFNVYRGLRNKYETELLIRNYY